MKHMVFALIVGSLIVSGCSGAGENSGSSKLRLEGNVDGCQNVESVCTASYPPQCYDYCADQDPTPGGDCTPVGDGTPVTDGVGSCGGDLCGIVVTSGTEYQVCYPQGCVVTHDVSGTDSITCPPGAGNGGPGTAPGSPPSNGGGTAPGSPPTVGGTAPGAPPSANGPIGL